MPGSGAPLCSDCEGGRGGGGQVCMKDLGVEDSILNLSAVTHTDRPQSADADTALVLAHLKVLFFPPVFGPLFLMADPRQSSIT